MGDDNFTAYVRVSAWNDEQRAAFEESKGMLKFRSALYKPDGTIILVINNATHTTLSQLTQKFEWIQNYRPQITNKEDRPKLDELCNYLAKRQPAE